MPHNDVRKGKALWICTFHHHSKHYFKKSDIGGQQKDQVDLEMLGIEPRGSGMQTRTTCLDIVADWFDAMP